MEKLKISYFEEENGCYTQDKKPITNFTVLVKKITGGGKNVSYRFEVDVGGDVYILILTPSQISRQRFLQELPVFIENEAEFYRLLRKAVFEKEFAQNEVLQQTKHNGLQKVDGKWMWVCTNGSIDKDGFHTEKYSGIDGMYLPKKAVVSLEQTKETIEKLFGEYNRNPKVFYPLFLINLMAITNGYFREIGEPAFMKLTLWIDGTSGSGKTELAKAAGTFTFSDENLNKELVSVTGKRRYALKRLAESSGSVCILDDVKNEQVRERKNSVRNIVDDYIRSVFQGRMTDAGNREDAPEWFDTCAIITGEYLDTNESQNARILYLKADGFLKTEKNSKALRVLQQHPELLPCVCAGYIQWFLRKLEESSFAVLLKEKLEVMRSKETCYQGINNAERLNENRCMILMAAELARIYFSEMGMPGEFIENFVRNAGMSIRLICDDTFYLLGGEQMVMLKVVERVFSKCSIRKAEYHTVPFYNYKWKYYQQYFWIGEGEDFVWIENYGKSLLENDQYENGRYDDKPCLIIRKERFMELMQAQIQSIVQEKEISSAIADKLQNNLMKKLKTMQIIYKQYRSDSKWGRSAVDYPVYNLCYLSGEVNDDYDDDYNDDYDNNCSNNYNDYDYDDDYDDSCNTGSGTAICTARLEPVVQININHPCVRILKEKMENGGEDELLENDIDKWDIEGIDKDELYKVRKSFLNSKSLYKE